MHRAGSLARSVPEAWGWLEVSVVGHAASENFRRPAIGCHFSSVSLSLHLSIYPSSLTVSVFILFLKNFLNIGVWLNYPLDGCFL